MVNLSNVINFLSSVNHLGGFCIYWIEEDYIYQRHVSIKTTKILKIKDLYLILDASNPLSQVDFNDYEQACRGAFHLSQLIDYQIVLHEVGMKMLYDLQHFYQQKRKHTYNRILLYCHGAIIFLNKNS